MEEKNYELPMDEYIELPWGRRFQGRCKTVPVADRKEKIDKIYGFHNMSVMR
ncbi:hypothetical protein [Lacicoccus alkaliphilus]|uniref:Uncharacterized protein n=1 Tax=Lacicoccus alkaliphilus DSM 16010 TaxID=1123231 RepID=A0A1M7JGD0_9BACL|nr:hypothetical protein [Salinicoccus alkaliphilus]SHM52084.1 hypothetical protein SAMN02745189_02293 [Salinicoccus alkaliphilus DSM 16010]